jgi:ABC-type cobalamin transport system ATPase subunit
VQRLAYATRRSALGLKEALVPLDELTVLLGPNDAGKSTLLAEASSTISAKVEPRPRLLPMWAGVLAVRVAATGSARS